MKYFPAMLQYLETRRWPLPALLAAIALLIYANSFPGTFIQDDIHIVRNNPLVAHPELWKILRSEYWQGIESSGLYRPLTILSLALNRALFGPAPWGFHLVNVLLHGAVTVLCWRMLLRWGLTGPQATLAAVLFALHPIHTEVVNQVVGRGELLAALFLLLALHSARGPGLASGVRTASFFLAALLAKEHAIMLLLLLPLLDGYGGNALAVWRSRLPLYGALLALTGLWFLWREFGVIHEFPATVLSPEVVPLAGLSWDGRFLNAILLQGLYLSKLLLPVGLQAAYAASDLPELITSLFSWRGATVAAAFGATLALLFWGWRRRLPVALLAALYLISFLPASNLLLPIGVTFAERLAYFPSVWFCAAVAVALGSLPQHKPLRIAGWVAGGCFALLLGTTTLTRNPDFSSEIRYWLADVRQNPRDHLALVNYAELLAAEGRFAEAEQAYRQLLALSPAFAYGHRSRGNFLMNQGRFDEALAVAQQALSLARAAGDRTAMGYDLGDLARIDIERREYARALERLDEAALHLGRDDFDLDLRGAALAGLGRFDEALLAFSRAPNIGASGKVQYQLALTLLQAGRLPEARSQLQNVVRDQGAGAESWNLLGAVCAQLEDWPAAVAAFEQATRLAPGNAYYQENLQAARHSGQ